MELRRSLRRLRGDGNRFLMVSSAVDASAEAGMERNVRNLGSEIAQHHATITLNLWYNFPQITLNRIRSILEKSQLKIFDEFKDVSGNNPTLYVRTIPPQEKTRPGEVRSCDWITKATCSMSIFGTECIYTLSSGCT